MDTYTPTAHENHLRISIYQLPAKCLAKNSSEQQRKLMINCQTSVHVLYLQKTKKRGPHTQTHRFPFQPVQIREWGSLSAPSSQVGGQQWRVKVRPTFPVIRSGPGRCSLTDKEQWGWRGSSLYNRPPRCRCVLCKWKKQVEERKEGLKRGNVNIS